MTIDRAKFFNAIRASFGRLSQLQVDGFTAVLDAIDGHPLAWQAYELATPWHETNGTMQPVREAYWLSEAWRKAHLRYWPWYGRGYVQLTWQANYQRAETELGLGGSLIANPDRAMEPTIAGKILARGMSEGWFSGKKLADYLPSTGDAAEEQFAVARHIINGTDKAELIATYAMHFQAALGAAA